MFYFKEKVFFLHVVTHTSYIMYLYLYIHVMYTIVLEAGFEIEEVIWQGGLWMWFAPK